MTAHKFEHWRDVPMGWFSARWPNFTPDEIACNHCGEVVIDEEFMDTLQKQRSDTGKSITLNSAYRCPIWNALVGGAPLSMHKFGRAGDQRRGNQDRATMIKDATEAGFGGIGKYKSFVHTDTGRKRTWGS